jgi:hypothetical protein
MALPGISITINPNGLRQLAASGANVCVKLGISTIGTVNTLYSFADPATATSTLGVGPLVEAVVDTLAGAGGTVLALRLNPTTAGGVTAGTHSPALGAGTVVGSTAGDGPSDSYAVQVTIVTSGALGAALFTYSLDGGNNVSGQILVPLGGVYAVPGANLTLTFAGALVALDVYTITTTPAAYSTANVTTAFGVILADATEWGFAHIVGQGASAAAAASLAAVVDTQMVLAEAAFRYVFGIVECPSTEADSALVTAFTSFVSERTMVCAGDIGHISAITGRVIRRNCGTVVSTRLSLIPAKEHPGKVARGPLRNVKSIYRNEAATPALDAQRFTTLRAFVKKQGYFVTRGNMMAVNGSDYSNVMNRRVMDIACSFAYQSLLDVLNTEVQVDKGTGFIYPPEAAAVEKIVRGDILGGLDGNAIDASVTVSKTEAILSTHRYPVDIGVLPFGYAEQIKTTIGFINPALA